MFQYEIRRTTEPLSLFNALPPPLPLSDVLRLKGEQIPSTTVVAVRPGDLLSSAIVEPAGLGRTSRTAAARPGSGTGLPVSGEMSATRLQERITSSPAVRAIPPALLPVPTPDIYTDTVVLVGGKPLACRILADVGTALRVELASGVIVHLPKQRIIGTTRKAPAP